MLYYHFVRQRYILPEQYVKLAADVADRTAYSGSDAVFAIYKASEVTHQRKGRAGAWREREAFRPDRRV